MPFYGHLSHIYISRKDRELKIISTLKAVEEKDCGSAVWIDIVITRFLLS